MSTHKMSFADRLFALGYWIGFKLHRRTNTKAVKQVRPDGALDWFMPQSAPAPTPTPTPTWEAALDAAPRQQAKRPLN